MLSIVVPAYNEGEHIYDNLMTIDEALKAFTSDYEIIAVNDGSRDNTGAEIRRAAADNSNIKDFGYDDNRGKGGAVTWGAVNSKGDVVGFIDADLDLSPAFLGTYYASMIAEGADIVIGSKMHKDSKLEYPFARKVFSFCYYVMLKVLFGLKCHDTQTGIKLYKGSLTPQSQSAVRQLHLRQSIPGRAGYQRPHRFGTPAAQLPLVTLQRFRNHLGTGS